jgi:hypothetical protein
MLTHRIVLKCVAWLFPKYDFEWAGDHLRDLLSKELSMTLSLIFVIALTNVYIFSLFL